MLMLAIITLRIYSTLRKKQYQLGKAFADTNKKLKASDAVVTYQHKLTALKRKYAEAGGGNKRMAAGIADLEKRLASLYAAWIERRRLTFQGVYATG